MFELRKKEKSVFHFNVKYDAKEWNAFIEEAYEKTKGKYAVQGFRKGKVPRKVIEQNYGANIFYEEAFEIAIQNAYGEILGKHTDLDPVTYPDIEILNIDDKGVEILIKITTTPEVKLGDYTGLTIETEKGEVNEEKVNEELQQLRERSARFVDVERPAQLGDIATIDFVGSVDGVEFDGGKAEDYRLELGSHSFVDTFEDQIVGMNIGEKRTIKVTFPEQYTPELAGKKADFAVTLNKVEEKELPELNDQFASDVSEFETLADFRADIKKNLQASLDAELKRKNEDKVIEAVVKNAEVDVPEVMVQQQLDAYIQDFESRLSYQGISLDDYFKMVGGSVEEFKKERADVAKENVKTRLTLQEIIKKENLNASAEEVDQKLAEIASKYKKSVEDYKKSMGERELTYFENGIIMDKLMNFLTQNNKLA